MKNCIKFTKVDFSELCITSEAKIKKHKSNEIVVRQLKLKVESVLSVEKLPKMHVKDTHHHEIIIIKNEY